METKQQPPIEISLESVSQDALKGLIDAFIMREGTDYGAHEITHETKVEQILKQLHRGDIKIVFDPNTETATLLTERDLKKIKKLFD